MGLVKTTVTLDEFHVRAIEDVCKRMGLKKAEYYRYAVLFMLRANTGMNIPFPSKILDEMRYVGSIMVNRATADGPMPPDVPDLPIPLPEEPVSEAGTAIPGRSVEILDGSTDGSQSRQRTAAFPGTTRSTG
jgi:hypothetical protein